MEPSQPATKRTFRIEQLIGIILLIPPVIGVFLFVLHLFVAVGDQARSAQLGDELIGKFYSNEATASAPIFLGLMAIAGAILLKGTSKK